MLFFAVAVFVFCGVFLVVVVFNGVEFLFPTYATVEPGMFRLDVAACCISARGRKGEGSQDTAFCSVTVHTTPAAEPDTEWASLNRCKSKIFDRDEHLVPSPLGNLLKFPEGFPGWAFR